MATIEVQPRATPEERADTPVKIQVDDALTVFAAELEDWAAPRPSWEFTLHEGHDFGRSNNVEGRLLYVAVEQTSSLSFRLDQVDVVEELMGTHMIRFEEKDGIARWPGRLRTASTSSSSTSSRTSRRAGARPHARSRRAGAGGRRRAADAR